MAQGLAHYYSKAKAGMMGINPHEATQHGEDLMIAGATGALLGLVSAATGGMDMDIAGMKVPKDGLASLGLALAGLTMRSPELKVASIAAAGSASARTFEAFFHNALGVHGDFDGSNIPFSYGHEPYRLAEGGMGFGHSQDRLVEAARNL